MPLSLRLRTRRAAVRTAVSHRIVPSLRLSIRNPCRFRHYNDGNDTDLFDLGTLMLIFRARPPRISVKLTPKSRKPRAHQLYSSPDHRGDFAGEKPVKVPTVFEVRKVLFTRAGCAILRNPFRGVICPVGGVAGRYDRRK